MRETVPGSPWHGAGQIAAVRVPPQGKESRQIHPIEYHLNPGATAGHGPGRGRRTIGLALSVVSMAMALAVALAHSLGWVDAELTKVLAITMGALLFPVVCMDPMHGLMVYAIVAPVSPEYPIGGVSIRVQDPLVAMILFSVILREIRWGGAPVPLRLKWWLIGYAVFAAFVSALAPLTMPLRHPPNVFYTLKVFQFVVLAICTALAVRSPRHILMLVCACILGLCLQFTQLEQPVAEFGFRLNGVNLDEQANVLGVYMVVTCGLILGCLDRAPTRMIGAALGIILLMAGYFVLQTQSRTSYISMGAVTVVGLFVMRKKWVPLLVLCGGVIGLVLQPGLWERFKGAGAVIGIVEDPSFASRERAYGVIWERLTQTASGTFLGGGRGTYDLSFADTQWGIELLYGGVAGLALIILVVMAVLWLSYQLWKRAHRRDDILGAVSVGGILSMTAAAMSTFGLTSWSAIRCGEIIFIVIGLMMAADRLLAFEERQKTFSPVRGTMIAAGGAAKQPAGSRRRPVFG